MPHDNERVGKDAIEFALTLMRVAGEQLSPNLGPAVASLERIEAIADLLISVNLGAAIFAEFTLRKLPLEQRGWIERTVPMMVEWLQQRADQQRAD